MTVPYQQEMIVRLQHVSNTLFGVCDVGLRSAVPATRFEQIMSSDSRNEKRRISYDVIGQCDSSFFRV